VRKASNEGENDVSTISQQKWKKARQKREATLYPETNSCFKAVLTMYIPVVNKKNVGALGNTAQGGQSKVMCN